jgi:outer membrane receptor for ferrienterochelin and colicin
MGKIPLSTFVLSSFFRNTTNSTFGATKIEGDKRIRYPENIDKEKVRGIELSIDTKIHDIFTIQTSSSFYHEHVEGIVNDEQIDNSGYSWDIQLRPVITLKSKTKIQLSAYYQAPSIGVQGEYKGFYQTSMSVKQQLLKDKLTVTLRIRDIFQSRKFESITKGSNFYSKTIYTPESPIITISVGYNLNSYKAKRGRGSIQDSGSGSGGSVF